MMKGYHVTLKTPLYHLNHLRKNVKGSNRARIFKSHWINFPNPPIVSTN